MTRALMILLALLAIASPARMIQSNHQAVIFVLDHSRSEGVAGISREYEAAAKIQASLPRSTSIGIVAAGSEPRLVRYPEAGQIELDPESQQEIADLIGSGTDYEKAIQLASGLFPGGAARHVVLVGDGVETAGDMIGAAKEASLSGIKLHALGVAGDIQPDVRVTRLESSQSRLNEGATLSLSATIESSLSGSGRIRLFENGVEVDAETLDIEAGGIHEVEFTRSPEKRNIYNYRVVVEGFEGRDSIPENNEALAIVDVRGKPLFLYVEGEEGESRYLSDAMLREGIRLDVRSPEGLPGSLQELAGYDGIILSDIAAHRLGDARMDAIRDYV
ncbi:MAG: VWA domain-containing protein, partial [Verrucomicrobiales bacterium]|nr:VWA domain-containing protein [Verrucomicrobiales bacterium]